MKPAIDQAITLMSKLIQEVNNSRLKLTVADWNQLSRHLKNFRQLLQRSKVTESTLEQAARSVITAFEKTPVLKQYFADTFGNQTSLKTKDTAGRLRKQKLSLTDIQSFENQVIELRTLSEQIEDRTQRAQAGKQQFEPEQPDG